jgi:adenosylhomocysteine nucleosidase
MMHNFGIIVAHKPEIQDVLANSIYGWDEVSDNLFYSKKNNIYLTVSGIGKAFSVYALSKIISKVDIVFSMGTSGGLSDEEIGSMYISTEFVEHDMDAVGLGFPQGITPFSDMDDFVISSCSGETTKSLTSVCEKLGIHVNYGRTISGDQFIHDPVITRQKKVAFNASLVDMETAAIAKICTKEKKDFIALRYISDNANHDSNCDWNENVKKSSRIFNKVLEELLT